MAEDYYDRLTYVSEDGPDIKSLRKSWDETLAELDYYFQQCRVSYDDRRNYWPGKTSDLRKHGADAFPWEGASDTEANIVSERINAYVSLFMKAVNRANIRAYPVEVGDMARSKVISAFLKWMVTSYIKGFKEEMELGSNYLLEKGLMITYVGWQQETFPFLRRLSFEEIAEASPEMAELLQDKENDDDVIQLLQTAYPSLSKKRARKALRTLRKEGVAELPITRKMVDRPLVRSLAADSDVFFPSYCIDPQKSPFIHYRAFMTAQEIENKVTTEGWDESWADYVLTHYRGVDTFEIDSQYSARNTSPIGRYQVDENELYSVIYTYQRLVDEEDGSVGIYCTVWHPEVSGENLVGEDGKEVNDHAKFELLNGIDEYPFAVTRLSHDHKRMYDLQTFADLLRGVQNQVKAERDGRIDRASLATLPPILHPAARAPADWGPGVYVPYHRKDELDYGPTPPMDTGSIEVEQTLIEQADRLIGLSSEDQLSQIKQEFFINKFLCHVQDVLRMCFKAFQRFGPDEIFFRVTGQPEPFRFEKGNAEEDFDIIISFDLMQNDPENISNRVEQFSNLLAMDRNGKIDIDRFLEFVGSSIDPALADAIFRPDGEAERDVTKKVMEDITKIAAGFEIGAQPNGAQIALQVIQQYAQQPDVAERLENDEGFAARLEKYQQQYVFQLQQAQNAQTGRIGTSPAAFQGANVGQ